MLVEAKYMAKFCIACTLSMHHLRHLLTDLTIPRFRLVEISMKQVRVSNTLSAILA